MYGILIALAGVTLILYALTRKGKAAPPDEPPSDEPPAEPPEAVTLDALEVGPSSAKVTVTNHTDKTFISEPPSPTGNAVVSISIRAYYGSGPNKCNFPYNIIGRMVTQTGSKGIGNLPPGTKVFTFKFYDKMPMSPTKILAGARLWAINSSGDLLVRADAGFKGEITSEVTTWKEIPAKYVGMGMWRGWPAFIGWVFPEECP